MKLVIQIPCYNEEEMLPTTLEALPRNVEGFDVVEVIIIDDGSTDKTVEVALQHGVGAVALLHGHQGLARAFMTGLAAAIDRGADIIVNTDADNQYNADDIPLLLRPIIEGNADMVIGARPIHKMSHFSPIKRLLQSLGSKVVKTVSQCDVQDAPSGFRAISRNAALKLNVFGQFTYTLETVIQAGLNNLRVVSVPIRVNPPTRPSRLFRSNLEYVSRSIRTIAAVYLIYRPVQLFTTLTCLTFIPGLTLGIRYLTLMANAEGAGHTQSLIACAILCLSAVFFATIGCMAHLLSVNRRLLEDLRYLAGTQRVQLDASEGMEEFCDRRRI